MTDAREALTVAGTVGGFFEVELEPGSDWQALATLTSDDALLREQVDRHRQSLARQRGLSADDIDPRPAASVWFLGVAARLLSPVFGAAVLAGAVPRCTPDSVRWQVDRAGRTVLALDDAGVITGDAPTLVRAVHTAAIIPAVGPLVLTCQAAFDLPEKVLWGNVSTALAVATAVLQDARPHAAKDAAQLLRDVIEIDRLDDTGRFTRRGFVRTGCCLIHRVPQCAYGGDCVMLNPPSR